MTINISVVKSKMLGTEFMVGAMTWAAIANQVLPPDNDSWDDIFGGPGSEEVQRKLNKPRVNDSLIPYLTDNDDAFFSSITIVLVPMDGSNLKEGQDYHFRPSGENSDVGELVIEDHVLLFPSDGQHRGAAITGALKKAPALARERVPVVFVGYKGKGTTRQLFSDLNLNAKPVSKSIGYAFEGRDPVVIITKRVIQAVPLLNNRINMTSNSLSKRSAAVATLSTLVACNIEVLAALHNVSPKSPDLRKIDVIQAATGKKTTAAEVDHAAQPLMTFWETFLTHTPGWHDLLNEKITAGELRDGTGEDGLPGHVSAYGIGWQAAAVAYAAIVRAGSSDPISELAHCLDQVNWAKGPHWSSIAMVGTRINNTGPGISATAGYILHQGGVSHPDIETGSESAARHPVDSLVSAYKRSLADATSAAA